MMKEKLSKTLVLITLSVILLLVMVGSLVLGQVDVSMSNVIAIILAKLNLPIPFDAQISKEQLAVVWFIRVPRMLVGVLVGASLGISGAVMQGIFSNPLADPGLIGVSSGAATGAVLSIAIGAANASMFAMPAFAFCGSLCAH